MTTSVKVAVVDDDEFILDAIRLVLEEKQWEVETYSRGENFLSDIENHQFDCLILDLHLPGISGIEVARSVIHRKTPIPIIGLTAQPVSSLTNWLKNNGAKAVLTKPVTAVELIEQIQSSIERISET